MTRTHYAQMISEIAASLGFIGMDARHIEGWMRSEHRTLDSLTSPDFRSAVADAIECVMCSDADTNNAIAELAGI